jgi:hypothetical protein
VCSFVLISICPSTKEWIVYPGVECFITPVAGVNEGLGEAERIFGNTVVGERIRNPENPWGFITRVAESEANLPVPMRTQAQWHRPRKVQEQVNRRIAEISSRIEPLNAKIADFRAEFNKEEVVTITLGLAPVETECYRLWALALHQARLRMTYAGSRLGGRHRVNGYVCGMLQPSLNR